LTGVSQVCRALDGTHIKLHNKSKIKIYSNRLLESV
jgi:hypothetical protein